ncbi:inactive CLIP domain-containing serine protease A8-like [Diorhabda carinulata]|uniref:inactive CLIP domain-containing serine protease A8-like n=1 Tax=Diorhabda carinulata TaxID=1163345 RepID=UPI0025A1B25D|nr:inactive CLIP domain-containing serine protease A8-like [Diorhabda carinulata]
MEINIFIVAVAVAVTTDHVLVHAQRSFNCAVAAFCNDVTIDPRIQTDCMNCNVNGDQVITSCPAGYIPCNNVKCGFSTTSPTISSGQATQNAYPWNVYLQDANNVNSMTKGYVGGGVLIDQYFVVTAAHKIYPNVVLRALFGLYDINGAPAQTIDVKSVYYHSDYNPTTLKNDIALLRLAEPVNIGPSANFICPPQPGIDYHTSNPGADNCVVVGFGNTTFTSNDAPYVHLKQAFLQIQAYTYCKMAYDSLGLMTANYLDGQTDICAGGEPNIDACTGDGGSGFVCRNVGANQFNLVGIVLWGKECGQEGIPGVYLYYPAFLNWVTSTRNCILSSSNCAQCPRAISTYCN